jgi:hypothetical protein
MKRIKVVLGILAMLSIFIVKSQEKSVAPVKSEASQDVSTETIEKTYTIRSSTKVFKNSIKVRTDMSQEMLFDEKDKGKVDQAQVIPKKMITKTVQIDDDEDGEYDVQISFSYSAAHAKDFVLVRNRDEIYVAMEDGDELRIIENQRVHIADIKDDRESHVITDHDGTTLEFYIDEYKELDKP